MNADDLVLLEHFPDEGAASLMAGFLESEGIPTTLSASGGVGPFPSVTQGARLLVLRSDVPRARQLLAAACADLSRDAETEQPQPAAEDLASIPADSVERGLARIRFRRGLVWFAWLSLPLALVLYDAGRPGKVTPYFALPFMALFLVAGGLVHFSRCPRCGKPFHVRRVRKFVTCHNPWARRCLNCGLPLHADRGP